ncbi:MAG: lamin tail domain-containing protein [Pirellulales bacterium]
MRRIQSRIQRWNICVFIAACLVTWLSSSAVFAEVIISEIMYNPAGTDLDTTVTPNLSREWVELYNTGTSAVDVSGWQFGDSQDGNWSTSFPSGTVIGANQTLVITGDTISFDKEWGTGINRIQVGGFPILANNPSPTNETATIRNTTGIFVDSVNFDAANGWPRVDGSNGQSIVLSPQGLNSSDNNIGTNWKPAMRGVYGATFRNADGENHGSPGTVDTVPQIPFAPSPDAAWSLVYLPDTQNYVKSSVDFHILTEQTTWIRDHRDDYKIKLVIQGGDIVNNNDTNNPTSGDQTGAQQWANAKTAFSILNGFVPYVMAAGNHDFGFTNADNRDTMINNYFKPSDNPLVDPAQGGILAGEMVNGEIQNAYYTFTAPDGRKMLVFSLEWEPRPATVAWANQIAALPQYADHTAVLLTHNYLQGNNTRSTSTNVAADYSGEELWNGLVKTNPNFEMTFNGHFGGDGAGVLHSANNAGDTVHQMFLDTQFETLGGDGWIRLVEFLNDGKTVRIRTYSTLHDLYRTGPDYSYEFTISELPGVAGDYNKNGAVDAADYVIWRNTLNSTTDLTADGSGDGIINLRDQAYWRARFGNSRALGAGLSTGQVPEPTSSALVFGCLYLAVAAWSRKSQRKCATVVGQAWCSR